MLAINSGAQSDWWEKRVCFAAGKRGLVYFWGKTYYRIFSGGNILWNYIRVFYLDEMAVFICMFLFMLRYLFIEILVHVMKILEKDIRGKRKNSKCIYEWTHITRTINMFGGNSFDVNGFEILLAAKYFGNVLQQNWMVVCV